MATTYDRHIFNQLQEVIKNCDNLSQEIKKVKKEHKEEIYKLKQNHKKEIKELKKQHKDEVEKLNKKINELEEELDIQRGKSNQKNSTNSSTPPSKDEYKKQNHREKSFRKQGGQKGRKGKTLTVQEVEKLIADDKVEVVEEHYGDKNVKQTTIKYIMDVKTSVIIRKIYIHGDKIKPEVPEECKKSSTVIYGNDLKALVGIMYGQEVIAFDRMTEFLKILTNNILNVSHGSLVNWIHEISQKSKKVKKKLLKAIKKSNVIYTDLTPTSLKGKYSYVRNYSNEFITFLSASMSKRIQEIQRQNILPNYKGYIMHDHEVGLYNFGIKSHHLECWIHLGRELKYFDEYIKNSWSKELWEFAWGLNKKRKKLKERNITEFTSKKLIEYKNKYDEIVQKGISQNKNTPSKYLKNKEKTVLNRLQKYKENYLNYLKNFDLPFDDNLSERDLRATKLKKKVSGCHRSFEGLKDYSNIRTIISTCIKQGKSYFELFKNILRNKPISINKQGLIMMP